MASPIKPDPKNELTVEQEAFALRQVTLGKRQKAIYKMLASADATDRKGLSRYEGEYGAFRKKITRLTQGAVTAKNKRVGKSKGKIDVTTSEGQLALLTDLINSSDATTTEKIRLLEAIQDLQVKTDPRLSPGAHRVLLSDPNYVKIDLPMLQELMNCMRQECGGLHNAILWTALNEKELRQLRDAALAELDVRTRRDEAAAAEYNRMIQDGSVPDADEDDDEE